MPLKRTNHFGLLAIGTAGRFTVEILESAESSRLLSIETDRWSFCFDMAEIDASSILAHLRRTSEPRELQVGLFLGAQVLLIRDDEDLNRFFLRTSTDGRSQEFVLTGQDIFEFVDAFALVVQDLAN